MGKTTSLFIHFCVLKSTILLRFKNEKAQQIREDGRSSNLHRNPHRRGSLWARGATGPPTFSDLNITPMDVAWKESSSKYILPPPTSNEFLRPWKSCVGGLISPQDEIEVSLAPSPFCHVSMLLNISILNIKLNWVKNLLTRIMATIFCRVPTLKSRKQGNRG